jgi:hypothetical protein
LVLLAVANTGEMSSAFLIYALGSFPFACVIISLAILYCTSKAWKWIGFSGNYQHSAKISVAALRTSVEQVTANNSNP